MHNEFIEKFLADSARYFGRPGASGGDAAPGGAKAQIFTFIGDFGRSRDHGHERRRDTAGLPPSMFRRRMDDSRYPQSTSGYS